MDAADQAAVPQVERQSVFASVDLACNSGDGKSLTQARPIGWGDERVLG
jgi:hypothetical protein